MSSTQLLRVSDIDPSCDQTPHATMNEEFPSTHACILYTFLKVHELENSQVATLISLKSVLVHNFRRIFRSELALLAVTNDDQVLVG